MSITSLTAPPPETVPLSACVYQAVPQFEDHLLLELGDDGVVGTEGTVGTRSPYNGRNLHVAPPLYVKADPQPANVFWHQNAWLQPFAFQFDSIGDAARALRSIQRNWALTPTTAFRRAALIAAKLPAISEKPRPFPWDIPDAPVGAWTLLDEHTVLASARCASPFPAGAIHFEENHEAPPSRAYLKLMEALTRARARPAQGSRCFDAGASPGGWTWLLASMLHADVTACDRAPLDDRIAALPGVSFLRHDAFTLKPADIGPLDWLFCDAACYPPRLLSWIESWLASGLCRRFVCTLKMQGAEPDLETTRRFAALGGTVVHLYYNKHELTWIAVNDLPPSHFVAV